MKASANFSYLASDLELNKATAFLRKREFGKAIETLKSFEKRDNRNVSAANNLSYLYFMLDKRQAEKYVLTCKRLFFFLSPSLFPVK